MLVGIEIHFQSVRSLIANFSKALSKFFIFVEYFRKQIIGRAYIHRENLKNSVDYRYTLLYLKILKNVLQSWC